VQDFGGRKIKTIFGTGNMAERLNAAPDKAILAERLGGMMLVIILKLLSKAALAYIMENFALVAVLR